MNQRARTFNSIMIFGGKTIAEIALQWWELTYSLMKLIVPMMILVEILDAVGGIEWLGIKMAPLMGLLGLPGATGLIWAASLLSTVYAGIALYVVMATELALTDAQVTTLMSIILIAHSLPVEQQIARGVGLRWLPNACFRLAAGFFYGYCFYQLTTQFGWLQTEAPSAFLNQLSVLAPTAAPAAVEYEYLRYWHWILELFSLLASLSLIILGLVLLLKLLAWLRILWLIEKGLAKGLRPLGIGSQLATLTAIGFILGISYGGGFILREVQRQREQSNLRDREIFLAMTLLAITHSVIEDTLLFYATGAHLSGILFGRIVFTIVLVWGMKWSLKHIDETAFYRYLFIRRSV